MRVAAWAVACALVPLLAGCPDLGVAGAVAATSSAGGAGTASNSSAGSAGSSSGGAAGAGGSGGTPTCADPLPAGADGLGLYDPIAQHFYLRRSGGGGDFDFDAADGNSPGALPVAGRWMAGDASDHVGIYDPVTAGFRLRNDNTAAPPELDFNFGVPEVGSYPCAGDWGNGPPGKPVPVNGHSGIGIYNQHTAVANLKKDCTSGAADFVFQLGAADNAYLPVAGDWNGDGIATLAVYVPSSTGFFVKNTHEDGSADIVDFAGAQPSWLPLAGDWDADATDDLGLYDQATSEFHLRLSSGQYRCVQFGDPGKNWLPLAGKWER